MTEINATEKNKLEAEYAARGQVYVAPSDSAYGYLSDKCAGVTGVSIWTETGASGLVLGFGQDQGLVGPTGAQGPDGDEGDTGPAAEAGPTGSTGPFGPAMHGVYTEVTFDSDLNFYDIDLDGEQEGGWDFKFYLKASIDTPPSYVYMNLIGDGGGFAGEDYKYATLFVTQPEIGASGGNGYIWPIADFSSQAGAEGWVFGSLSLFADTKRSYEARLVIEWNFDADIKSLMAFYKGYHLDSSSQKVIKIRVGCGGGGTLSAGTHLIFWQNTSKSFSP